MIDWLVKKTRTYKNLLIKFNLSENHNEDLAQMLKDARKNDHRDTRGRYTRDV